MSKPFAAGLFIDYLHSTLTSLEIETTPILEDQELVEAVKKVAIHKQHPHKAANK